MPEVKTKEVEVQETQEEKQARKEQKFRDSIPATQPEAPKKRRAKVLYPKPFVDVLVGKEALTAEQARKLMGWQVETDKVKFGKDFLLKDTQGQKVRCKNNIRNRPIYPSDYNTLIQEILQGKWELNMENRIIGRTGVVLNGQHTFIALILACEMWEASPESYPYWSKAPTI